MNISIPHSGSKAQPIGPLIPAIGARSRGSRGFEARGKADVRFLSHARTGKQKPNERLKIG